MDGLIDNNREYKSGENIACYRAVENVAHGFCLFLQDNSTPVKGGQIFDLINALIDHGCKGCGSIPVDWENSNDPSVNGILTMNYVGATGCEGLC
uniref:Killer toxin Kp4 domain-containing protein n=1 Tax=Panagrolaimus davidi TaxID=227884 RepID=A0A914PHG1_9BILA